MTVLKFNVTRSSAEIALPEEMLARLNAKPGDTLYAVEMPDGYFLTRTDPKVMAQVEVGKALMERYRETFEALAKS